MDIIDREELITLAQPSGWPSVSLYLPTHKTAADKGTDRLRLKNLLSQARVELAEGGLRGPDADTLLAPADELLQDDAFWRTTSEGLAVFLTPETTRVLSLDAAMPEQSVVGNRFYLRPLTIAYRGDVRFFALAVGLGGSRLFSGGPAGIEQVPLPDAPESMDDELKYDVVTDDNLQSTTFASPASINAAGRTVAMFHGHGGGKDVRGDHLKRYLRHVEQVVSDTLDQDSDVPLLLLGVRSVTVPYRELSTYHALVDEEVTGAVDELTPHQIHQAALTALRPRFEALVEADLTELGEKGNASLVSKDPAEILEAAAAGRVKTLFLDQGTGPFGHFDRETFRASVECRDNPRFLRDTEAPTSESDTECGWDLVDLAIAETAMHGGAIRAFSGEDSPVEGVAAVFRY